MKDMADKAVASVVNGQLRLPLRSEAFASNLEPLAKVSAVNGVTEGITVLGTNKAGVIVGSLFAAEPLPFAEIIEGACVPMKGHLASFATFAHLTANSDFRLAGIDLNIDERYLRDFACP